MAKGEQITFILQDTHSFLTPVSILDIAKDRLMFLVHFTSLFCMALAGARPGHSDARIGGGTCRARVLKSSGVRDEHLVGLYTQ